MNVGAKLTKNCGTLRTAAAAGADCAGAANLPSLASGVRVIGSAQGRISPWTYLLQGCLAAIVLALTITSAATGSNDCMSPCWRMVAIGVYKNVTAMRAALGGAGLRIAVGETANEIMGRPLFQYAQSLTGLRLYRVRGFDLGYHDEGNVSLRDIYQRASELEYDLCPAEVGPMLRLSYLDQAPGEFLEIAHLPVHRYGGQPIRLMVGYDGWTFLLLGNIGDLETMVPAQSLVFVFCKAALIASR